MYQMHAVNSSITSELTVIKKFIGWGLLALISVIVSFIIFFEFIAVWELPEEAEAVAFAHKTAVEFAQRKCPGTAFDSIETELNYAHYYPRPQAHFDFNIDFKTQDGKTWGVAVITHRWVNFGPLKIPNADITGYGGFNC